MLLADTTAYCQTGTMADGSQTRAHTVAMNNLPLGTKIRTKHPIFGMRHFVVRDHIGHGSEMDVWTSSCAAAWRFGRRTVAYVVTGREPRRIRRYEA